MSLINDLNRLDRAGSEHSRATQKLRDACLSLANHISDKVIGFACELPTKSESGTSFQRYAVVEREGHTWLAVYCDAEDGFYDGYFAIVRNWDREQSLAFAKDISSGLLPAISKWLEISAAEADAAAEAVTAAKDSE